MVEGSGWRETFCDVAVGSRLPGGDARGRDGRLELHGSAIAVVLLSRDVVDVDDGRVSWLRDRRGWGPLRLRYDRRAARRAHPIHRDLRAHLLATLRRRWKDFTGPALALVAIAACLALPSNSPAMLRGVVIGICIGALATLMVGLTLLADGSLLRRIGLGVAEDVGDDLRRTKGVYGVVSTLMFDGLDVDHIVLTPAGVFVLEVKWSLSPTAGLQHVWGLQGHLDQTRAVTRKVTGLLRSSAPGLPVHPVLVLCGPGAPALPGRVPVDQVVVVNAMSRREWASFFTDGRSPVLTLQDAGRVAEVLMTLRDRRIGYELAHR